jgi:hypothetical protein
VKKNSTKVRAGISTLTAGDERLPTALLVVPMDLADFNVSKTLLFLI